MVLLIAVCAYHGFIKQVAIDVQWTNDLLHKEVVDRRRARAVAAIVKLIRWVADDCVELNIASK